MVKGKSHTNVHILELLWSSLYRCSKNLEMLSKQGKPIIFALCADGIHSYFSGQWEVCVSGHDILIKPPNRNQGSAVTAVKQM